jgi:ClpP class serine protease
MGNWAEILEELGAAPNPLDAIRRKYLDELFTLTGRNVIVYYSGWLQKPNSPGSELNDSDKTGFMNCVHRLNKAEGLDLILHTPGGETAATESLIDYLKSIFGNNIRAIIPQLAMSAGTVVACACKEIVMGKHSSLGPIDPQFQGVAAHGIVEEFERAYKEIKADNVKAAVWQPIISKYPPTFVGECDKAIKWTEQMVKDLLLSNMFSEDEPSHAKSQVERIVKELGDHALTKSHSRHLSIDKCRDIGLKVTSLESDQKLQEAVLSVHHACIHTLASSAAVKIIENHLGKAYILSAQIPTMQ